MTIDVLEARYSELLNYMIKDAHDFFNHTLDTQYDVNNFAYTHTTTSTFGKLENSFQHIFAKMMITGTSKGADRITAISVVKENFEIARTHLLNHNYDQAVTYFHKSFDDFLPHLETYSVNQEHFNRVKDEFFKYIVTPLKFTLQASEKLTQLQEIIKPIRFSNTPATAILDQAEVKHLLSEIKTLIYSAFIRINTKNLFSLALCSVVGAALWAGRKINIEA